MCSRGGQTRFNCSVWLVTLVLQSEGWACVDSYWLRLHQVHRKNVSLWHNTPVKISLAKAPPRRRGHFILPDGPSYSADIWCAVAMFREDICGSFVPCASLSRLQLLMMTVDSWEGNAERAMGQCQAWWDHVFLPLCFLGLSLTVNHIHYKKTSGMKMIVLTLCPDISMRTRAHF